MAPEPRPRDRTLWAGCQSETKPCPVLVPPLVPPLFGLSAESQLQLSVAWTPLEPGPVVVVQVPVSNVLPWAGFTAPAGPAKAKRVPVHANRPMTSFFFTREPH